MDIAGLVKVKVQADLSELDRGFADAREKSGAFDREASRAFRGVDLAAKNSGRSIKGAAAEAAAMNDNFRVMGASSRIAEVGIRSMVGAMSALGLAAVAAFSIKPVFEFKDAIAEVSTLVDTATFDMARLEKAATQMARSFGGGATAQVKAFNDVISAGTEDLGKATQIVEAANKLAIGGASSVAVAADGLTNILNAYGDKVGSATEISDAMFISMRDGKTTIEELSGSLGRVAPIAAQTGVSFDELTAAIAALTLGGISTSEAVTGVRAMLSAIAKPSGEAAKLAQQLGIEFTTTALKAKGLVGFLEDLMKKTGGSTDQLAILFGGVQALVPAMALAGSAGDSFAATMANMEQKAGATEDAFDKMAASPGFQAGRVWSAFQAEIIKSGSALGDVLVPVLKAAADNMERLFSYAKTAAVGFGTYYVAGLIFASDATWTLVGSLKALRVALIRTGIGALVVLAGEAVYQFSKLVDQTGSLSGAFAEVGRRIPLLLDAVKFGFFAMTEAITAIWYGAMADILRATEDAFGPILRTFGIATESMGALIERYSKLAAAQGDLAKTSAGIASDQFKRAFGDVPALADEADGAIKDVTKSTEENSAAVAAAKDAYGSLIERAQNRIDQLRLENELVGKAGAAAEALRFEQDLLAQVMEKAGKITPEQRKEIHALALEYGNLAQALEEARLKSDLMFERSQIGRSDVEQRVAGELRSLYGDDYQSHMNGAIAGQIRYNEELKNTDDLAKDAFDTIIDALTSSGDLADNLIKAFAQIGKMFAQIGQQKLFDYITGKSSSLSGLSGLSGLANVGGGGVSVANAGREAGRAMAQPISDRFASVGEDLASNIHAAASTLGVSARDLATVIHFESGFNPRAMNPNGKNIGLIQFGLAEQKKYGVSIGQAISGQMQATVDFLKDRGLKPGMDLLDLYSTINAGSPGRYNAVDGTTNVREKVMGSAMANSRAAADRLLGKQAVSDGVVDADRRISSSGMQQNQFDTSAPTSVAGMSKMQGMLGVGGAAIGAFAGGYESGSPLMGGISGAMSGLGAAGALGAAFPALGAAAGPIGLIGGAIIGILGGIFGKAKQKREELKKAQQELEGQIGAITNLMRTATGNYLGAMEKEFGDTVDEFQKAITMAEKAKNSKLVAQLKESQEKFFDRLVKDWNAGFQGTLDSLNAGLGMDGEFLKGMDAVDKMRESLVGFINDAKFFAESNGDLSSMLDARKKALGIGSKQEIIYKPKDDYTIYESGHQNPGTEIKNSFEEGYKDLGLQLIEKGFHAFNDKGGQFYDTLKQLTDAAIKAGFAIDEQGKVTRVLNESVQDAVQEAMEAARKTALASLSGGKAFSEIEQAIQRLEGAAASLPELLSDLGMSAEEAAKAIQFHLNIALRDLKNGLASDLQSSINDLSGFGFLNDILGAQTTYEARVKDLQALGMDTGAALQELGLRLRNIAKDADLTDDQLKQLADVFPQLGTSLTSLIGASLGTTSQALEDAKAKVEEAKSALRASYEKEIGVLEQAKSAHDGFIKSIKDFLQSIKLDSALSPLDPTQRFQEAQSQFFDVTQKALGGDEEAIGKVEDVSRQYLEEARAYYGTSEGYFSIFNEVNDVLNRVLASSKDHLTDLDKQLAAMKDQMDAQLGTTDAVLSVADAIANLAAANAAQAAAQSAYDAAQQATFQQMLALLKETGQAYDPTITGMYRDVLGRAPDAEGADYYTKMLKSGMSVQELLAKFTANAKPELDRGYATPLPFPGFASGGMHSGGLRMVGENGPELEATGASRIWNAGDTARMLRQSMAPQNFGVGNDNSGSAVLKELQAVKAELSALRAERKQGDGVVAAGAQANVAATIQTTQAVREQTSAARRESKQRAA